MLLLSFYLGLAGCAPASNLARIHPKPPEGYTLLGKIGEIAAYTLDANGLHVIVSEDATAPVATVMLTYQTGSVYEEAGRTGAAHFLEHMMFKRTPNYAKENGQAIADVLQATGAITNATTRRRQTTFLCHRSQRNR